MTTDVFDPAVFDGAMFGGAGELFDGIAFDGVVFDVGVMLSGLRLRSDGRAVFSLALSAGDRAIYRQANGRLGAAQNFPANRLTTQNGRIKLAA